MSECNPILRICRRTILYSRRPIFAYVALCLCIVLLYAKSKECEKSEQERVERAEFHKRNVNIYVVEEHHEVVEHWLHETKIRNLNTNGSTLIHVDAHSDLAPPDLLHDFPFFHWPKNEEEIQHMQQRNDVFILGAAAIGLFDHIIWIFPSWDASITPDYEAVHLELGYLDHDHSSRSTVANFCECRTPYDVDGTILHGETECTYGVTDGPETGNEVEIPRHKCHVMKSVTLEMVVDHVAVDIMERGAWIKQPRSVVFDIDEDFFGCESGYDVMSDAGVEVKTSWKLSNIATELICPHNTQDEDVADKLLKRFLAAYIDTCHMTKHTDTCKEDPSNLQPLLSESVFRSAKEHPELLCRDSTEDITRTILKLLELLKQFNLEQIKAVLELGFCMETSPATLSFKWQGSDFHICHGVNLPNQTIVTLYTPPLEEVVERMDKAHKMFSQILALDTRTVTICRSVRDGYAPRKLANFIESRILDFFRKDHEAWTFREIFNPNLMGGEGGWHGRSIY